MDKEPLNCMSVRIPREARRILKKEVDRLEEEQVISSQGEQALLYIKRGELFEEMLAACEGVLDSCLTSKNYPKYTEEEAFELIDKVLAKAQPLL